MAGTCKDSCFVIFASCVPLNVSCLFINQTKTKQNKQTNKQKHLRIQAIIARVQYKNAVN